MTPTRLLATLAADGFTVRLEGNALKIAPASRLPASMLPHLHTHKPALVALIRLRDYELWTHSNKVDGRHARYLRQLHAYAQHISGEWLRLDGTALRRMDYDPAAGRIEAERMLSSGEIDMEIFNGLIMFAAQAEAQAEEAASGAPMAHAAQTAVAA